MCTTIYIVLSLNKFDLKILMETRKGLASVHTMIEVNTHYVDTYEYLWGLAFCQDKILSPLKEGSPTW